MLSRRISATLLRRLIVSLFLLPFLFGSSPLFAGQEAKSIAIDLVRKEVPGCEKCSFFAVPGTDVHFKRKKLFFVSTLDRLPPPMMTVAISDKGKGWILSHSQLQGWNEAIQGEKISLATDDAAITFAKSFLELAYGRALYIDKLNTTEEKRLRLKIGKDPDPQIRIVRAMKKVRIQFFGKDASGALEWWDLTVNPNGEIEKASSREF